MKKTTYYSLLKPEGADQVNIEDFNSNFDTIDAALKTAADASGDLSRGTVYASAATSRTNLTSGDSIATMFGKVMKWFSDLKDAAFCSVANNDTTTAAGSVADARIVKTHGDEIDKHTVQLGGLYLGQNAAGKWGYKPSANGTIIPFRNPTGTATAAQVLSGYTFANASSDSITGTMANNGTYNKTLTPTGNNTTSVSLPAGYYSGGTITANGATSYSAGYSAGAASITTIRISYTAKLTATQPTASGATKDDKSITGTAVYKKVNGVWTLQSGGELQTEANKYSADLPHYGGAQITGITVS